MKTDAEIYVELATAVAQAAFSSDATVEDLRAWWIDEEERRILYELDVDQVDRLIEVCRQLAMKLPEKEVRPQPRKPYRRRSS